MKTIRKEELALTLKEVATELVSSTYCILTEADVALEEIYQSIDSLEKALSVLKVYAELSK